jgi:N-acetylmuramoyl-L-alanine amidase
MKRKLSIVIVFVIMIIGAGFYLVYEHYQQKIMDSIDLTFVEKETFEYGENIDNDALIQSCQGDITYQDKIDSQKVGSQKLKFIVSYKGKSKEFYKDIQIQDTKSAEIKLKQEKIIIDYNGKYNINENIESVKEPIDGNLTYKEYKDVKEDDVAYYTYSGEVDVKKEGTYDIKVIAIDRNGNKSEKSFQIQVKEEVKATQKNQTSTKKTENTTSKPSYTAPSNNKIIVIDPGHQGKGNHSKEAIGPGASTKKAKVASGATGVFSKKLESQINLEIGLKLRDELKSRGYTVVMTRTSQNVDISNQERAKIGNKHQAAAVIHLHCDSSNASSARGAHTIAIAKDNPYCPQIYSASSELAQKVIRSYCQATGIKSRGVSYRNDLTGLNWSEVPSIYIEMGFISNTKEDQLLTDKNFQYKCAKGIADGIDAHIK